MASSVAHLTDFMISRVRMKLYCIFFGNLEDMYYVRQLTRMTGEEINAVRRELGRMEEAKIIDSEKRGNRLYYFTRTDYDYFDDLVSMVTKSQGIGLQIRKNRHKIGKIKYTMLSGKFVYKKDRTKDDVDLLIVGEIHLDEIAKIVKKEEERHAQEINYTVLEPEEFAFRKQRRDPFIMGILSKSKVMIIGDQQSLVD